MTVLPDVLQPGLIAVFCGTAASRKSAAVGAYYAGPGNRFWPTLYKVGLIPEPFTPLDFRRIPHYGLGLTDIAKHASGTDDQLKQGDFDAAGLRQRITQYVPQIIAFTSKRAAQEAYGHPVNYGWQNQPFGPAQGYVLPSPSGAARRYWDETHWQSLADAVRDRRQL